MRDASLLLPVHQTSVQVIVICSSRVRRKDKVEGVEFLEAAAASSMRFWVEVSSSRYQSKSVTKLVMSNWYMTEMSSAWSQVYTSQAMCLIVGVIELRVVNGEFMMMSRCSTWR